MGNEHAGGYGNPPKDKQFKPGQSGNPRGRPRKAEQRFNGSVDLFHSLAKAIYTPQSVIEKGKKTKKTPLDIMMMQAVAAACKGDYRMIKFIVSMLKLRQMERHAPLHVVKGIERLPHETQIEYMCRIMEDS